VFDALSDGGQVQQPLGETFFSPAFGLCIDRFGTPWMVMVDEPAPS
jgi:PhnB protein